MLYSWIKHYLFIHLGKALTNNIFMIQSNNNSLIQINIDKSINQHGITYSIVLLTCPLILIINHCVFMDK